MPEPPARSMFTLAHLTDPHVRSSSLAGAGPWALFGKRAVGGLNLIINRRRKHRMELLAAMADDLKRRAPDHLVVTGDLGNIGLPGEWRAAAAWLGTCGVAARDVTVIPGNHDIYTPDVVAGGWFEAAFEGWQKADHRLAGEAYPFVRFRGQELAIVACNTCVPTGDLGAWGRMGGAQLKRLETLLTDPELEKRLRVVLLHHPPVRHRRGEDQNLRDRDEFAAVLARTGAELILHGHDHRDERAHLAGPRGVEIPVVGAGSASYAGGPASRARYNIYEIEGRRITAVTYAHDEASGAFREVARAAA